MEFLEKSLTEIIKDLNNGVVSSEQLVLMCKKQIEEKDSFLNCLNSTCFEDAISRAKEIDRKRANGEHVGKLAGAPVVIKDNINKIGTKTTCSSKLLENYESVYNATVVEKIEREDGVIIGKANMDEFAMGSSNENSAFGIVRNPNNTDYVPGGSSGGSAACVKANECFAALGTDTGGSIREPASFCGIVGIKPTYSRVSRYGVVAFASSLDQVGPLTRTVEDNALMLEILAGYDEKENTSSDLPVPEYSKNLSDNIKGLKIGVAKEFFALGMDEEVERAVKNAIEFYKNNGAEIVDVSLDNIDLGLSTYYILSSAEAASNLGRYDGIRYGVRAKEFDGLEDLYSQSRTEGFGREVKRRIMLGNFVLSSGFYDAYYKKAQKVQQLFKNEFNKCFEKCDVLISPVCPSTAFKIGEKSNDHLKMYLSDVYTVPVNVVGVPAISFPCGKDEKGLPIGLQLIGKKFDEQTLYILANYFEKHNGGER
ncbi:MAG: Asp-tRNA(Asn)/Glu-tRNA(Gln) amidotransferase subunit GatA [Clostridiales bacterium]|nr:Asp-tRNA(Asn)/Glu-tRNA(Gln) amidotransferase subunit GatA [Candidatus Apopatousia equi]